MRKIKTFTHILDLALLNKFLAVIIQPLEPKILNEKVEDYLNFLFYRIKTSNFSFNISDSKDCMMTSKYLFDRTKFRQ